MSSFLLVDDDPRLRDRLAGALRDRGHAVAVASGPAEALERAGEASHVLLDLRMPGGDGLALLGELLERHPDLRIVVLTGYGSIPTAVEAMRAGAVDYLTKPADADQVLAAFAAEGRPPGAADAPYEPPSLDRAEWEHIHRVLEDLGGNVSQAARKLGIHRRTLQRKLSRYAPRK